MAKNLVIVESPAKAKTIEGFLGKDFTVKSSFGHIRDLNKNQLSVDLKNDFLPHYEVPGDKKKVVEDLSASAAKAEMVWLASDEDREGEAIAWHLYEALGLKQENTKRIVFHEITKSAITHAIETPRFIDFDRVNAQQARRVLDRLVGYELSPLLWKKVKPALSAGRVQSVTVRLIVERENEIKAFKPVSWFRVTGKFLVDNASGKGELLAELSRRLNTAEEALAFLHQITGSVYTIGNIEKKPSKRTPAPPFTTSTLQQEAARKLGFSVAKTMMVAQQLYEAGLITYMRTDSVNLSDTALGMAKKEILALYGEEYLKIRKYTTKSKGAQEAHEAIRPTYMANSTAGADESQRRLYDLIWKRTIASQMSDAILEKTIITLNISKSATDTFVSKGEVVKFDGFLKGYIESTDDESDDMESGLLPPVSVGEEVEGYAVTATRKFSQPPLRYAEAGLVKKLEELGIGRPSTYAPIISTIQKREYVEKKDIQGEQRSYEVFTLRNGKIKEETKTEKAGYEKGRLVPTDIGNLVTLYLMNHFEGIMDYHFTARVEKEFDDIAEGKMKWNKMIASFYKPFHSTIEKAYENQDKVKGERLLGIDPATGKNVYVKLGRFGAMVQLGETNTDTGEKPKFAGLKKTQGMETITLDEALDLLKLPRSVGKYNDMEIVAAVGRFGPYLSYNKAFFSVPATDDPATLTLDRAIAIIEDKKKREAEKVIKTFAERPDVVVQNGRYGPYISIGKQNVPIPKKTEAANLTLDECLELLNQYLEGRGKGKESKGGARKPAKAAGRKTKKS